MRLPFLCLMLGGLVFGTIPTAAVAGDYRYGPNVNRYGCSYGGLVGGYASAGHVYRGTVGNAQTFSPTANTLNTWGIQGYAGPFPYYDYSAGYVPRSRSIPPVAPIAPWSVYHDSSGYSYYPGQYRWSGGQLQYIPGQYIYNEGRPGVGVFSR